MPEEQHQRIVEQLQEVNRQLARQNSYSRMFLVGVVYGIGFFVGSAILATIAFGILGPWVGQIPWVRDAFVAGVSLLKQ